MNAITSSACILLLVEDNPGDADLVREMLDPARGGRYEIVHVTQLASALETLKRSRVDVVVLDLRLPDCAGVDSVKAVKAAAGGAPLVVLTGNDDEQLALACIAAGAQDYLSKTETRAQGLRRAIGYALSRQREAQLHELQRTLDKYRALSSHEQRTTVTAAIAGSGAIKERDASAFANIVHEYFSLVRPYLDQRLERLEAPRDALERVATLLGDANGGPRDLLDAHLAALDRALQHSDEARARSLVFEARLLALEMMGLLVDYYRVGFRRRSLEGRRP
jgi:CheY-like chemotaxis protein